MRLKEYGYFNNYEELKKCIAPLKKVNSEESLDLLDSISNAKQLITILNSLLKSDCSVNDVAERSFSHPNGFDRIDLIKFEEDSLAVRLHIWWESQHKIVSDIHNHSWDFCSKVLTGSLTTRFYIVDNEGSEYFTYNCSNKQYDMEVLKKSKLKIIYKCLHQKSNHYFLENSCLHDVTIQDNFKMTSTLVLQGGRLNNETQVYTKEPIEKKAGKSIFTPLELREKLSKFVKNLERNGD